LKKTAIDYFPEKEADDSSVSELALGYGNALMLLDFFATPVLLVGLDLANQTHCRIPLEQFWRKQLSGVESIRLEKFQESTVYDLVLTTNNGLDYPESFHLSEFATDYDVMQIIQLIEQKKSQKFEEYLQSI